MKKVIAMVMAAVCALSLTACGSSKPNTTAENWNYKTGLATYTHTNNTYGWSENRNGQSAVSTTIVAAVFDNSGKIVKIKIDEVESKTGFDAAGQLINYTGEEIISKKEMGDNYGMRAASGIGKEWYEQIETLEKWLEGRDVNTVISSAKNGIMGITGSGGTMTDNSGAARNADGSVSPTVPGTSMFDGTAGGDMTEGANSTMNDMSTSSNSTMDGMTGGTQNSMASDGWMDEDLRAGVTIDTTYIQKAIEKAYRNAK